MEHWLVTLGYQNLGGFDATVTGQTVEPDQFQELVSAVQPQSAYGWTTSVGYQFMLSEHFFAQGQLGLFNWESESDSQLHSGSYPSTNVDNSGHALFYGIELGYKLLDNVEAGILYQHYSLDKNDIESLGVGLKYNYSCADCTRGCSIIAPCLIKPYLQPLREFVRVKLKQYKLNGQSNLSKEKV